jgi:type II secretory pathway pseudopilin PulG
MTSLPAFRNRRRRLRSDDGFIIVEVLVSAVILVTVSLAVFLTLDNADKAAGNQQRRTLAANFAQSELERIRSLPVEDVAAARGTRTLTFEGIEYEETILAKWVTDGSDEPECSTRTGGLDYLRTTVTLKWKGMGTAKPVKMTSFYTPPAGAGGGDTGSVSVHITDRNGGPVSGIGVTLDGPATDFSEATNANGCVVFGFVPAMPSGYSVKFSRSGFVDGDSNPNVVDPIGVTEGETTKLQYDFDRGGFTKVTFRTRARGTELVTKPERVQFFNAAQPTPPKTFALNQTTDTWDGSSIPLFPFTSAYAVYAGNCQANAVPATNADAKFVNITPNVFQNTGVVYLPALDVTVRYGTPGAPGAVVDNAMVMYDPASCAPQYRRYTKLDATGQLADPGFPYAATGLICAAGPGSNGRRIVKNQANVNFGVNGTQLTLFLNDTGNKSAGWTSTSDSCFT